jgi:hypothetical protein
MRGAVCPPQGVMKGILHKLSCAAFLLAAGCSGVVVLDDPGPRGRYFIGDFDYAAGNGAIETLVAGNPFGVPKKEFDDRS